MRNFEKFKTAQERADAFFNWCVAKTDFSKCKKCVIVNCCDCCPARGMAYWLDLEAEEEKPETIDEVIDDMRKVVEMMRKKESEGDTLLDVSVIFDKFLNRIIAAHKRVAKAVRESEMNHA